MANSTPGQSLAPNACNEQIQKKEELLQLLNEVEPKAKRIEDLGTEMVKKARLTRDIVRPLRTVVSEVPADQFPIDRLDLLAGAIRRWHEGADRIDVSGTSVNSFSALALSAATSGSSLFSEVVVTKFPSASRITVQRASDELQVTLNHSSLLESVKSSIQRLNLDSRGQNQQTSLEMIDQTCGALERPVVADGGPVSVVIPIRESVKHHIVGAA